MSSPVFNHLLVPFWAEVCVNRLTCGTKIHPAKSNSLGHRPAWRPSFLSQYRNTSLAMLARNKVCRLQQARMWSEWKELQARETLASHAVLLLAHAAHPPPQPQPQPRCSGIALLSSQAASVPERFGGNALHKSTSAGHQWLPFGVTDSLSAVRDAQNKPCTDYFLWS